MGKLGENLFWAMGLKRDLSPKAAYQVNEGGKNNHLFLLKLFLENKCVQVGRGMSNKNTAQTFERILTRVRTRNIHSGTEGSSRW